MQAKSCPRPGDKLSHALRSDILCMRGSCDDWPRLAIHNLADLDGCEGHGFAHLVGNGFDLDHIALESSRNVGDMYVYTSTRFLQAMRSNSKTTAPINDGRADGTVYRFARIDVLSTQGQFGDDLTCRRRYDLDIGKQEVVDGAVALHPLPD